MIDLRKLSEEERKLVREAWEAGANSVLDDIYTECAFDLEGEMDEYITEGGKIMRKRLPNHPSKIDPNKPEDEKDLHQKAPIMKKKLSKLKI